MERKGQGAGHGGGVQPAAEVLEGTATSPITQGPVHSSGLCCYYYVFTKSFTARTPVTSEFFQYNLLLQAMGSTVWAIGGFYSVEGERRVYPGVATLRQGGDWLEEERLLDGSSQRDSFMAVQVPKDWIERLCIFK